MTESALQDAIRLELGRRPDLLVIWRNNIGNATMRNGFRVAFGVGGPGAADLIGLTRAGHFVALEIKTPTGRQSPEQRRFAELVTRLGGTYLVLRSVDDARAWLASLEAS